MTQANDDAMAELQAYMETLPEWEPMPPVEARQLALIVADVRRLRALEVMVRANVSECPQHGMATAKYPCPAGCPWPPVR